MTVAEVGERVDEQTPLLVPEGDGAPKKPTPLPIGQILILLVLQMSEPVMALSILPYINQLIGELPVTGGDKKKIGYYAGLIESLYFATEAITVLQWSRLSDHVGRKPILLFGVFGMIMSALAFGLSRTFWTLVVSRCLNGALNGNIGVMKSMMAELTDNTNMAQGFALMPVTWALGATIGPFVGGVLSRPHDRFPHLFAHQFWQDYPYFLPCAVVAGYAMITFLLAAVFLKETVKKSSKPSSTSVSVEIDAGNVIRVAEGLDVETTSRLPRSKEEVRPLPLSQLLTRPVLLSVSNYAALALLDIALVALWTLFYATPIELGGLGFDPPVIGYAFATFGVLSGILQYIFFPITVRRYGPKAVFVTGISMFVVIFAIYPLVNQMARRMGMSPLVWILLFIQLIFIVIMDMSFSAIFMYISTAAPNKRSIGATNGLAQTAVSIQRAVGPALSTSLFAFSLENNIMGGYFVYVFLIALSVLALCLSLQLPSGTWKIQDDYE